MGQRGVREEVREVRAEGLRAAGGWACADASGGEGRAGEGFRDGGVSAAGGGFVQVRRGGFRRGGVAEGCGGGTGCGGAAGVPRAGGTVAVGGGGAPVVVLRWGGGGQGGQEVGVPDFVGGVREVSGVGVRGV